MSLCVTKNIHKKFITKKIIPLTYELSVRAKKQ